MCLYMLLSIYVSLYMPIHMCMSWTSYICIYIYTYSIYTYIYKIELVFAHRHCLNYVIRTTGTLNSVLSYIGDNQYYNLCCHLNSLLCSYWKNAFPVIFI